MRGGLRNFRTICSPSIDLCRGLLALRDVGLVGRMPLEFVPMIVQLLRFWKVRNKSWTIAIVEGLIYVNRLILIF